MSSYRQILYHIIFRTKNSIPTIPDGASEDLYRYIHGIIANNKSKAFVINGSRDHIHILCDVHPSVALANLIKDIKVASSMWLKESGNYPMFEGWADGYGAFTYSINEMPVVIAYIARQKEHHKKLTFVDEYRKLLEDNNVIFDERYFP